MSGTPPRKPKTGLKEAPPAINERRAAVAASRPPLDPEINGMPLFDTKYNESGKLKVTSMHPSFFKGISSVNKFPNFAPKTPNRPTRPRNGRKPAHGTKRRFNNSNNNNVPREARKVPKGNVRENPWNGGGRRRTHKRRA